MTALFLGAGFSRLGGVPLARNLFDDAPIVDRIARQRLVERVLARWSAWHEARRGAPEEYLAELQSGLSHDWHDAVWFVSLAIALKMGNVEHVRQHVANRWVQPA